MLVGRTLLVTNDFPPRQGGIQSFVHHLAVRQPPDSLVVYASRSPGWQDFDRAQPFEVVRADTTMLLPTPAVRRQAAALARSRDCEVAWFGAMAPLGLLGPTLRNAGVRRTVAQTHGHEAGWAILPGARGLLRRIAVDTDVVTYLGGYTRDRLARAVPPDTRLEQLAPGVDLAQFHPGLRGTDGATVRARLGLADRPVVVCVSRLVPRKGQDVLLRALPAVRRRVPDAALLLVSDGPYRSRLERLVRDTGMSRDVVLTGAVPEEELAAHYAAGDVFAMPCRTRRGGLDVEGFGIVYLEAAATGLPVLAGRSGGAPDAVRDGETGFVVDGRDVEAVAERLTTLLTESALAATMGRAGRAWVERQWGWDHVGRRMRVLLDGAGGAPA